MRHNDCYLQDELTGDLFEHYILMKVISNSGLILLRINEIDLNIISDDRTNY